MNRDRTLSYIALFTLVVAYSPMLLWRINIGTNAQNWAKMESRPNNLPHMIAVRDS